MSLRRGPLKFSLRATIDHNGPSIHSGHYTASINYCKKYSIATKTQLRSLELLIAKTPLLHMLYYMNWLTHELWTRPGGWEFDGSPGPGTSSPSHWKQVEEQVPKPVGWMMCFLLVTLFLSRISVLIYIYIYMHSVYEFCYRKHIYTQQECHSVLVKMHLITFYRNVFLGSAWFLGWMPTFCFLWFTNYVLLSDKLSNTRMLVPFGICFKQQFDTRCSAISHFPGYICSWTFFQNIGFNMEPSDHFM